MDVVLNCAVMKFLEDFFMQFQGIVMGTYLTPLLRNMYMTVIEEELYNICNIKWPKMLNKFIDDGFAV